MFITEKEKKEKLGKIAEKIKKGETTFDCEVRTFMKVTEEIGKMIGLPSTVQSDVVSNFAKDLRAILEKDEDAIPDLDKYVVDMMAEIINLKMKRPMSSNDIALYIHAYTDCMETAGVIKQEQIGKVQNTVLQRLKRMGVVL